MSPEDGSAAEASAKSPHTDYLSTSSAGASNDDASNGDASDVDANTNADGGTSNGGASGGDATNDGASGDANGAANSNRWRRPLRQLEFRQARARERAKPRRRACRAVFPLPRWARQTSPLRRAARRGRDRPRRLCGRAPPLHRGRTCWSGIAYPAPWWLLLGFDCSTCSTVRNPFGFVGRSRWLSQRCAARFS